MNLDHFGMDTITLAGPLEAKLAAIRAAGFTQVMLNANDLAGHPGGAPAAIGAVRTSGLRVTGFQVLRDFEGLSGHLHAYKVDIAKAMLQMCHDLGTRVLLACSSTSAHGSGDNDVLIRDLNKLALLAVPFGIRIAYEALSWGRHVNQYSQSWDLVQAADRANLGLCLDSFHVLAHGTASIASLRRSRAIRSRSSAAWASVVEHPSRTRDSTSAHMSSIDFATSILYSCRRPVSASKSRSTWKPVTRSPLARTARQAAGTPSGCDTRSRADSMTWVNPASRIASSFTSSGPASEIVSMPKSSQLPVHRVMIGSPGRVDREPARTARRLATRASARRAPSGVRARHP